VSSYSRPTVYVYLRNFVSIGLFCHPVAAENPNFCRFFGLLHLVVSPFGSSLRKLNTGAQLQTFPYPTVSKSFLYSHAFMAKSGAQSLTFKSVTFLAAPAAGEIRAPPNLASESHQTWHGDRRPRARSCTSKTFAAMTHSFAARGR